MRPNHDYYGWRGLSPGPTDGDGEAVPAVQARRAGRVETLPPAKCGALGRGVG
jgi:hypothetical protein